MGANEKHAATYHGVSHNPDTDLVRTVYAGASPVPSYEDRETAFDRWLETVRAEAKAEALEEASYEIDQIDIDGDTALWIGPEQKYTLVSDWLRNRANTYK